MEIHNFMENNYQYDTMELLENINLKLTLMLTIHVCHFKCFEEHCVFAVLKRMVHSDIWPTEANTSTHSKHAK